MISAATAATAVLMVTLVRDHGLQYLLAATVLAGVLQVVAGLLRLGELMRFVSRSVITGFVNALAILIFMAQLPELIGVPWLTYVMVAAGLAIIYLLPRLTRIVPSPLICIVVLSAISIGFGLDLRTVGDMGELPSTLPVFLLPEVPFNLDTLLTILPYSAAIAIVGLLESLMTATIVDDLTDTRSDKNRECVGQGVANFVTGFLGGMAGCAMIGQSVINVKSGGRGRLSTFFAGMFLLFLILVVSDWVKQIPMAALVAVMIMVSIGTFSWTSLKQLRTHPRSSSIVMLATVVTVVVTHNLALGVLAGVLLSRDLLRLEGGADLPGHLHPRGGRHRANLYRRGPAVLRLRHQLQPGLRLQGSAGARADRCPPGAYLGHLRRRRAGQRGAEVPPRGGGRRACRHERGQRHHRRSIGRARQARGARCPRWPLTGGTL